MNKKVKSEQKLNLKKNQEISLVIEDFTREGEGLGKYQGFPLFVKDTVIGDEEGFHNKVKKELWLCSPCGNYKAIRRPGDSAMSCGQAMRRL